ncbi:RNA-binding protein 48 isoform X1 [Xenopus laevis]|uniref:RNA-binding protein 48 n=3 Tax=Xenopus laevis TaxID=8355 RepID=A0A974HDI7_XENLA|nr:RNA-binding protein 48 isoform X1 [Xenopus laevis]OCT73999.1 hypothetical protein XELAEV_18032961mg [Xenopus laevis]
MAESALVQVQAHAHHEQRKICPSRAKYREGRRPRAVKVYTINLESRYLLVQGVPAIGVMKELIEQFALYGTIEEYNALDEYPAEEFTEVYLIRFQRIQSARVAKRKLDERSFFGGVLHICYAPEFEAVQETREKLQERRKFVARATSSKDQNTADKKQEVAKIATPASTASASPIYCRDPPLHDTGDWESCHTESALSHEQIYRPVSTYEDPNIDTSEETVQPTFASSRIGYMHNTGPKVPGKSTARFMPRTTQLQERQRKRQQNDALALCGSVPGSQEIVIGPQLPEIPKLDMDNDSLNITANVIREKLKEVSCTVISAAPGRTSEDAATRPPVKQRRRI